MTQLSSYHKILNDPIHGHLMLDQDQLSFIDTPQFQRLRDLKQLGACYYVFVGATHCRFQHSIGVSYLADKMVTRLQSEQPELEINERDVKCVKIAGLCHDLGHGPFSHVFDSEFIPRARPHLMWSHEKGSELMLQYLIDENGIDIDTDDVKFVKDLIRGETHHGKRSEKRFLFDIVANKRNGVDVDKFDYLQRDCHYVGLKYSYDYQRPMSLCRVIDDEICFSHKEVFNLYSLFHTRFSLFKRIYTHKVNKAVEMMIVDAMLAADKYLGISECIESEDMESYCGLTDDIIKVIERSKQEELKPAKDLIKRLRKRQLYKFVEEYTMPGERTRYLNKNYMTPQTILSYYDGEMHLTEDDIIIDWCRVNYGMSSSNPVDSIKFFGKWNTDTAFKIDKSRVSYLVPEHYEDLSIRVFSRDPEKVPAIQRAFRKCFRDLTRSAGFGLNEELSKGYPSSPERNVSKKESDHISDQNQSFSSSNSKVSRDFYTPVNEVIYDKSSSSKRGDNFESDYISFAEGKQVRAVTPYDPHPINDLPNEENWQKLVQHRGWSPHKPKSSKASPNGINGIKQRSTNTRTNMNSRAILEDFDDI